MTPWPRPIPVRLKPPGADDLFVMTLGEVQTPLADGTYDPVKDRVTRTDGTVIEHYYRDELGIKWYQPLDKSVFPLPPAGWCSWYYYYQEIDAKEVLANARWIAEQLRPFGARYVQIDDGWQGTGHGMGENRDWTTIDARFRDLGMDGLAAAIRKLGLEAGLWLAPHGQSNDEVVRASGAFLLKPDGTSASSTWEGLYLVDPSTPAGHAYLRDLFQTLCDWGYTYFKIDGQPIVLAEYEKQQEYMAGEIPSGPDPATRAAELYRGTLRTIRGAIGPERYLLGCWGIPLPGVGIMNGSRTAGDIVQGWNGFLVANDAVQGWNFLHNIAWYCDPDVCLVRPPLSDGTARAWVTIQGLTGQALLMSDRLPDLPPSRVELLKRVCPPADIRPLDLYKPDTTRKPIWLLKIAQKLPVDDDQQVNGETDSTEAVRREYDVVGVFNYDATSPATYHLSWERLGLEPQRPHHVYDFWQQTYLGAWEEGLFVTVPPHDVRVLTLVPAEERPVVVSTSRHITQGWQDLLALSARKTEDGWVLRGRSRVVGGDPYALTIGLPRSAPTWTLAEARVGGEARVRFQAHQGYATVRIESDRTQAVDWELTFSPCDPYVFPVSFPTGLNVQPLGLTSALATWSAEYHSHAAYRVYLDGNPLGVALTPRAVLNDLQPGHTYRVGVRSLWSDGSEGEKLVEVTYTPVVPEVLELSAVEPVSARQDWGELHRNRSVDGNPLKVAGKTYARGLGTHAASSIIYRLHGLYDRFEALVGVDDEAAPPQQPVSMIFEVWGDGRRLWTSGAVVTGQPAVSVRLPISGVDRLELRVSPGEGGIDYKHADWLEPRVTRGSGP